MVQRNGPVPLHPWKDQGVKALMSRLQQGVCPGGCQVRLHQDVPKIFLNGSRARRQGWCVCCLNAQGYGAWC